MSLKNDPHLADSLHRSHYYLLKVEKMVSSWQYNDDNVVK